MSIKSSTYRKCTWDILAHYASSLAKLCGIAWTHLTYKMLDRRLLPGFRLRWNICRPLSCMQYMGRCVISWPISFLMIARVCALLVIIKLWNNGMCCVFSMFLWENKSMLIIVGVCWLLNGVFCSCCTHTLKSLKCPGACVITAVYTCNMVNDIL